jgi:hypothetical protein
MTADDLGALDERAQPSLESRMALQRAMRDERTQRHRPVDIDAIEAGHPVKTDDVARAELATAHLDDEIGSAREEAAVGTIRSAQSTGVGQRCRLVVLKAHRGLRGLSTRRFWRQSLGRQALARSHHEPPHSDTVKPAARWFRLTSHPALWNLSLKRPRSFTNRRRGKETQSAYERSSPNEHRARQDK